MNLDTTPTGSEGALQATVPIASPQGLHLSIVSESGATVVVLAGELDYLSATSLRAELDQISRMTRRIDLDMRRVEFLDSAGIGAIAGAHSALRDDCCELTIRNPSAAVQRVLELTGLAARVPVVATSGRFA